MTYAILPAADLTQQRVDDCIETVLRTVRRSLDDTQAVLKWQGATPDSMVGYQQYTNAEILPIMRGLAWEPVDD